MSFIVENPNGSNVLHQDLERIHEDDLEAMDLKWQLSLLSVRAKKYYQRTGKKIFINGNDIAGYDKSKVECYNSHKLGHFTRECTAPRSKEGQFRNQDNTRKQGNNEDTSKAMLAIDGVGFDWSDMAEEQVQTNMALMAFSDSERVQTSWFEGYRPKDTKNVNDGALIIEDWVSDDEEQDESKPKSEKKSIIPTTAKKEFAKPENHENPLKRSVRNERDTLSTEKAKIEEELVGTKSQLEHRERLAEEIQGSIASFFQSDFTPLVRRFLKSGEFNWAFTGVLNTAISIGVERGLRMDRTDEEFRRLSQEVDGFIPDDKEKFDRVIAAFLDTTFPFLDKVSQHSKSSLQDIARLEFDRVTPSPQPSSGTASLRTNTHVRHSTSSHGTFGHTSTPEHLRKRRSPLKKEVLQLLRPALGCSYFILFM
ncbi:hypothetical protein Tco_1318759 [Tanacetum coccineum]